MKKVKRIIKDIITRIRVTLPKKRYKKYSQKETNQKPEKQEKRRN